MKKVSRIGLLSVALLLGASVPVQAASKKQSFFQKHKRKLIAGVAAAAAIGLSVALALHTDKTMTAIEKADIKPGNPEFGTAVAMVGLLGPLGVDRALNMIVKATKTTNPVTGKPILSKIEAVGLVHSNVGSALAKYFGLKPVYFKGLATGKGLGVAAGGVTAGAIGAAGSKLKQGWNFLTRE